MRNQQDTIFIEPGSRTDETIISTDSIVPNKQNKSKDSTLVSGSNRFMRDKKTIPTTSETKQIKNKLGKNEDLNINDSATNWLEEIDWLSMNENFKALSPSGNYKLTNESENRNEFIAISGQNRERAMVNKDGFLLFSFVLVLILIWIKLYQKNYFGMLFNSLMSYQASSKMLREKNSWMKRISIVLNFFFVLIVSLFIKTILEHKLIGYNNLTETEIFLLIFNIVIGFFIVKYVLHYFVGILFDILPVVLELNHNNFLLNKNLALFLFPLLLLYTFAPNNFRIPILFFQLGICSIFLLYKIIRWIKILNRKDVLLFYSFLYLCTLEILPVLLGYKFFKSLV